MGLAFGEEGDEGANVLPLLFPLILTRLLENTIQQGRNPPPPMNFPKYVAGEFICRNHLGSVWSVSPRG